MKKSILTPTSILLVIVLTTLILSACSSTSSQAPTASSGGSASTSLDGATLMQQRCIVCHSTSRITSAHKTAAQWKTTVGKMINNGAQLSAEEEQTLIDYLAQTYK